MKDGIYKVTFDGPEIGSGIVIVRGKRFIGGDGYFYYSGVFSQHVGEMEATFEVKRHTPGTASVFGRDSLTATLTGTAGKEEFFLEAPGKAFTITGRRLETSIFDDYEKAAVIADRETIRQQSPKDRGLSAPQVTLMVNGEDRTVELEARVTLLDAVHNIWMRHLTANGTILATEKAWLTNE